MSFRGGSVGPVTLVSGAFHGIGLTQRCFACVFPCEAGAMPRPVSTLYSIFHDARDGSRFESIPIFSHLEPKVRSLLSSGLRNLWWAKNTTCCNLWGIHVISAQKLLSVLWFHFSISVSWSLLGLAWLMRLRFLLPHAS